MSDMYMAGLPKATVDSKPFWDGCNDDKLLLQRCGECHRLFYFARRLCPHCGGTQLTWEASTGLGTVYSFSEVHVAFQGEAWKGEVPYTTVLVDLDDGPRMLSRLVGERRPEVHIGDRVRVLFPQVRGQKLPFFTADR